MKQQVRAAAKRLFFVDAIRAWAILMMLQGHFIDGLLHPVFRELQHPVFQVWNYFRGVTAPVFFTISGFIATYLLLRAEGTGLENPRVKKGIRRGLLLILIGYGLRLNVSGLLHGELYAGFYVVDVLHCIGLSLLCLMALYVLTARRPPFVFPLTLAGITLGLFLLKPVYAQFSYEFLPTALAHYFTKAHGAVFTIFPWLGYATAGGALAVLFTRYQGFRYFYPSAIGIGILAGCGLVFCTSDFFALLHQITGAQLFQTLSTNNPLFMRLGDVFFVLVFFIMLRHFFTHPIWIKTGSATLSIYVIHFILLYGSFTGWGLYRFFHHTLSPAIAIPGALAFMGSCVFLSLYYTRHHKELQRHIAVVLEGVKNQAIRVYTAAIPGGYRWKVLRIRVRVQQWWQGVRNV